MTDIAIRVENLSKLYHIGRAQQRHDTTSTWLSAGLRDAMSNVGSRMSNVFHRRHSTFQIRDSTFQIRHLLKILSRITEPTSGRAETCPFTAFRASSKPSRGNCGRVGSLLESLSLHSVQGKL